MTRKITLALAGAAALSVMSAGHSYASDHELRYARAELATDSGAIEVYGRIARLAADVCDERLGRQTLVRNRAGHDRCEAEIIESLVSDIDDPRLSYLHAVETHNA